MKRRALLAGSLTAAATARSAEAQSGPPVVGFVNSGSAVAFAHIVAAFREGLREAGYVEGQNVAVEYRWAEGDYARVPELVRELVARRVAVLAATGGEHVAMAARPLAGAIPMVFAMGSDPVAAGLVASLARPGGTITGATQFTSVLHEKRFALLREAVPAARRIALLLNPGFPASVAQRRETEAAAARDGVRVLVFEATAEREFASAFDAMSRDGAEALIVGADPFFNTRRADLVALAASHHLPAIYEWRDFVVAGGLLSYGTILTDAYRLVGLYVGRILGGANPADLPVTQPTRFELAVNLRTAKSLGLVLPATLIAAADEVIE